MEGKFTFCPHCGTQAEAAGRFCGGCGESLARQSAGSLPAAVAHLETLEVPAGSEVLATAVNGAYAAAPGLTPSPAVVDIPDPPVVLAPVAAAPVTAAGVSSPVPDMTASDDVASGGVEPQAEGRPTRLRTGLLCAVTATGSAALVVLGTGAAGVW